ncbi:glycosyltransferase family 2 protein [Hufsiella ginkgonis]|uniref:Glycosyltransferase n=1 Tax=Hufsiella ginkgonis TaxID=2695274 RepID=A0A7K1Y202_9SPHI|nr:glycosyltransferase family 2 protein [Hufsiella ginkgonis]MXV17108.1 glycosyltransferase [Hufsiella ginkgonis]
MEAHFSFIILTYNEECHLPGLFNAISGLNAPVYVLDTGSTDRTLDLCEQFGAITAVHPFYNHPVQWQVALDLFPVNTPWIIGLDADQRPDKELFDSLRAFRDEDYPAINGIYFRRRYFFKGKWIRFGGCYPMYQLKMFRRGAGYSDLNENTDHRFVVHGRSVNWKNGFLVEDNQKDRVISFWIQKHNRYSDLFAQEEIERRELIRVQVIKPGLYGTPDQRRALLKLLWWKLPRYIRPGLYFIFRLIFQLGILDGRTGILYHFLQAFWFRLLVDIKIGEMDREQKHL